MITPELRIFITGKTQSGKTYLAKHLLSQYANRLIYDIKREYGSLGAVVHSLPELENAIKHGCNCLVYQPGDLSIDHFNDVCGFIYRNLRNIVFCVDEVHKFATKWKIPYYFNNLVTICQGQPYNIGIIAITQRPANVHNDIISSSTLIICFRLNLITDAQAVTGIPAEKIIALPLHHFLIFDDRSETGEAVEHPPIS